MLDFVREPRRIHASLVSGVGHTDAVIAEAFDLRKETAVDAASGQAPVARAGGVVAAPRVLSPRRGRYR